MKKLLVKTNFRKFEQFTKSTKISRVRKFLTQVKQRQSFPRPFVPLLIRKIHGQQGIKTSLKFIQDELLLALTSLTTI